MNNVDQKQDGDSDFSMTSFHDKFEQKVFVIIYQNVRKGVYFLFNIIWKVFETFLCILKDEN